MVASYASIASKADLLAADAARDIALCGRSLGEADPVHPDLASAGAHEPTPTPYFVLEELLGKLGLTANDHLLDVGCGTGRVLAYAASQLPCRATGVELDARLANIASSWAASSPQLNVIAGSVLDISLAPYTCFYLFNPFDTAVLTRFLDKAEREAARPFTLVHMSDNGESFAYLGRPGWRLVRSGSIQMFQKASGRSIKFYEFPQHYSVWRYEGVK
ncbi:class I SAM-dependent methyltransferase [Enorma massiliensis]|uniref:class I SAM-dependent methyltransferase n=1 Tax=Enorma massiliensis TaxID=1472761 RepID=UPI003A8EC983